MSSVTVDSILESILAEESGEYTNKPGDSGGPTRWGITLATLSAYLGRPATAEEVQVLERDEALKVLHRKFVEAPRFDEVLTLSASIGERLVDGGVLCGPSEMSKFLQRALNVFNYGNHYLRIGVSGVIANETLQALRGYLAWRGSVGESLMIVCIECQLGAFFVADAEHRPKDEEFVFGWFKERIKLR